MVIGIGLAVSFMANKQSDGKLFNDLNISTTPFIILGIIILVAIIFIIKRISGNKEDM